MAHLMTEAQRRRTYYNFARLLSFNGILNFVLGGRGIGKSYGAKKRAIRNALKRGDMFVYVRRYREELTLAKATFFADVEREFPNYDFRVHGWAAQSAPVSTRDEKKREWKDIGYFIAMTSAQKVKSASFPRVQTIIYDEFIAEKGVTRYLPDEVVVFLNLYSTIARDRENVIVLLLANSVSIMNPFFIEYKIRPDEAKEEFIRSHNGFIVCHFPDSKEFNNETYETRFGQFIKGTEYGDYAIGNEFRDNDKSLIERKDPDARYRFTLETKEGTFSVWVNYRTQTHYAQQERPRQERILTVDASRMTENKTFVTFSSPSLATLRAAFRSGKLMMDEPSTRNALAEIFKR